MKSIRYKVRPFPTRVLVISGNTFTAMLTEADGTEHTHVEEITESLAISHVCFFRIPGQGIGCIFGPEELVRSVRSGQIFVNSVEIDDEDNL